MIILAVGMPRAGSGWHYNLVHDLVVAAGGQDARAIRRRYLLAPILTEVNCNIRTLSTQRLLPVSIPARLGNTFAIKTHSGPTPYAQKMLRSERMRATYIYRDPRAALLSAIEYGRRAREAGSQNAFSKLDSFDKALDFMLDYARIWERWMAVDGLHTLRYEDFLAGYKAEAERLADFLSADMDSSLLAEAIEAYRPEQASQGDKGLHFQHGKAERFREALSAEELARANEAFAEYLPKMGYQI